MIEAHSLMRILASARQLFHSEADFQHAVAWELHKQCPGANVRLERPIPSVAGLLHLDLIAEIDQTCHAFELKYKTRSLITQINGEIYELLDHGAQPLGRYDFLKDIQRLELTTEGHSSIIGHAILLTNDSAYWCQPRGHIDTSADFSLCEGRSVTGTLKWSPSASMGTMRKRETPIHLTGQYRLEWRDYSKLGTKPYSQFRYLVAEIESSEHS
jgi:hypothetical protein